MICSFLNNEKFGFIELHPEQVYTFLTEAALNSCDVSITKDGNEVLDSFIPAYLTPPIYANTLTVSTLEKITNFLKESLNVPPHIFLDFNKITNIQKNMKKEFTELKEFLITKSSNLYFINFDNVNQKDNNLDYLTNFKILKQDVKIIIGEQEFKSTSEITNIKESIFKKKNHIRFVSCFTEHNPPYLHESSSVYLNQYFDFKLLLSGENIDEKYLQYKDSTFIYYCMYRLALKMIIKNEFHEWEISPNNKIIIFCQTLHSSYIGSCLADLLGTDIFLIDHLGPKAKLYSKKLYQSINEKEMYLVVSDVLCLGSELKNSKAIIEYSGAEYIGNVAFLRIESRENEHIDFNDIEFFYRITKTDNPVNYTITTALNDSNE